MRKYVGIPFVNHGSDFSGADCFGLIRLFYKEEFGYIVPDPKVSCDHGLLAFDTYLDEIQSHWNTIVCPQEFCVVAMAHDVRMPKVIQHFGIYHEGNVLHSLEKVGSHIVPAHKLKWCIRGYHTWQN